MRVRERASACEGECARPAVADMATKSKARRKISLPWFRQSSFVANFPLFRQHTIDTPRGFRAQVRGAAPDGEGERAADGVVRTDGRDATPRAGTGLQETARLESGSETLIAGWR